MRTMKFKTIVIGMLLCATLIFPSLGAAADENTSMITTDGETVASLGLLVGDGEGVTTAYLSKSSTRLQAAIISLRLQGKLAEAQAYTGTNNFSDANLVSTTNQMMLSYLLNHPELGWNGTGNNMFDPLAEISSQQLYKVLLEVMGYKTGTDFAYADTETFAASHGLIQISGTSTLSNAHIATALVEALSAKTNDGMTLFAMLQANGTIADSATLPQGERLGLLSNADLGTYFTDGAGRTLYFFTKDAVDLNSCQGNCLTNWPIYYSEHLQIPATLNASDFSVLTREDGTKQTTYKGWPLYYFFKDAKAGDVFGEAAGGVWFVAKADYAVMLGTSADLGNYLTDDHGRALYYFDKDIPQTSVCEGQCLVNWPAYLASGNKLPSNINSADLGTITRSDGSLQSSYKGYPLYYFIKDKVHGDITGQNVGRVWFVVDPAKFTGTTAGAAAAEVKTYNIDIKEYSFGTEPLTVEAGSKIVFTNYDDMEHSAVAVDGSFKVPLLAKGESYTITLDKAGTYDYYCEPHKSFMTGQIIVK